VSTGVDLAIGLLLPAVGGLVVTGRLHGRRKVAVPAGRAAGVSGEGEEGRLGTAGAGSALARARHAGRRADRRPGRRLPERAARSDHWKSSTATQVVAVVVFVLIESALIIIPFMFLELRPEATKATLKHAQDWLLAHARQLMAYTALILGAYLAVSGRPATAELTW
jgi:hypothetical protein